jgi:hypothetical protein
MSPCSSAIADLSWSIGLYGHPSKARARDRLKMLDAELTDSDLQQLTNG